MKKILFILIFSFIFIDFSFADLLGTDKISDDLQNGWGDADFVDIAQNILVYLVWLLYFIAVVFWLFAWFKILTAAWDEEKVKEGKSTMINVIIGLVVIFLSSVVINWVIETINSDDIQNTKNETTYLEKNNLS